MRAYSRVRDGTRTRLGASNTKPTRWLGAMGACDARTQGAPILDVLGVLGPPHRRCTARVDGPCCLVLEALGAGGRPSIAGCGRPPGTVVEPFLLAAAAHSGVREAREARALVERPLGDV